MAKNKAAVALGRRGGLAGKGQPASAAKLAAVRVNGLLGAAVNRHRAAVARLARAEQAYAGATAEAVDAARLALAAARAAVDTAAAGLERRNG